MAYVDALMQSAGHADLTYVNDLEPGYRRRGVGRGFFYLDQKGKRIDDRAVITRIRALAIPPAWSSVWICHDAAGHIQATGRDQRGRKQYRYHVNWIASRNEAKFASLAAFARALPKLRQRIDVDLRRRGLPRERVIAAVTHLLDHTMIRVGNDIYAQENKSFGLTTLHSRHLDVVGSSLRFSFRGKSGKEWRLKLSDRRIASVARAIQDLPGQRLFQYLDDDGKRHDLRSQDVNDYIRTGTGQDFSSKHFRTWGATVQAKLALSQTPLPDAKREQTIALNRVLDEVAKVLRNTRAICRRCYVHPGVVDAWAQDRLGKEMKALRRRLPRPLKGLDASESTVLRWLGAQLTPG